MPDVETFSAAGLVAPHPLAAAAGRDVLAEGGHIVEAVIAAAAVSAVAVPEAAGLWGDALWLIRAPGPRGRVRVLDARGLTGGGASPAAFRERHFEAVPLDGPEAVLSVPGAVAGWAAAHDLAKSMGGRLPLSRLLQPALGAARDGLLLSAADAHALTEAAARPPGPGFADIVLEDGKAPEAGTRRRFPALADTLDQLGRAGLDDLYRGDIARELFADLDALGSPLTAYDLRHGGAARWREPASLDLAGEQLDAAPNRRGARLLLALGLFAGLGVTRRDGFAHHHGLIEALKRAAALCDAAPSDGLDALLTPERRARELLDPARATRTAPDAAPPLAEAARWIGAVDRDGAAVSLVVSQGGAFGARVVSRRTGILLGNRGGGTSLDPGADTRLWPGRRLPLAAVPVLSVARRGRVTALGVTGPGGVAVAAQLLARLALGEPLAETMAAPRFGFGATPGDDETTVRMDERFDDAAASRLRAAGHLTEAAAAPDRAGVVSRLANARIEAVSDDGAMAGL